MNHHGVTAAAPERFTASQPRQGKARPVGSAEITPGYMLLIVLGVPIIAAIYYVIGANILNSRLSFKEYIVFSTLVAIVVTGGYQLFFWVQRNNHNFRKRCFATRLDDCIPFWPSWIWVYSFLYYLVIGFVVATIGSMTEGIYLIFGGVLLLVCQAAFFFVLPSTVPAHYRKYEVSTISTRMLRFVQSKDNGRNCMPSMHCSMAMYVGLLIHPTVGDASWIFVGLIAASCLLVKQHQIADIPPGIALGWLAWYLAPTG